MAKRTGNGFAQSGYRPGLIDALNRLGDDELAVVELICTRMANEGVAEYGELDIATDDRDFGAEALAEIADAVFYAGVALEKLRRWARGPRTEGRAGGDE